MFVPSIWLSALPAGTYQEGRDSVLGLYCAFGFSDRIEIHHVDREVDLQRLKGPNHEPRA